MTKTLAADSARSILHDLAIADERLAEIKSSDGGAILIRSARNWINSARDTLLRAVVVDVAVEPVASETIRSAV